MTLLSICQDTADVIGLTRPSAIITAQDQLARQMLGLARETLEELGLMPWPVLDVPYTFDTVVDQASYDLPADWGYEIGDTVYSSDRYTQLRGSLTPGDWQRQRSTLPAVSPYRFRVFGMPLKLYLTPTPTVVEPITLEYRTNMRVQQSDTSLKATYFADNDVALIHEDLQKKGLKWRLRRAKGLDYSEEFDDYEQDRAHRLAQALQFGSMPVAYRSPFDEPSLGFVPDTGFGV